MIGGASGALMFSAEEAHGGGAGPGSGLPPACACGRPLTGTPIPGRIAAAPGSSPRPAEAGTTGGAGGWPAWLTGSGMGRLAPRPPHEPLTLRKSGSWGPFSLTARELGHGLRNGSSLRHQNANRVATAQGYQTRGAVTTARVPEMYLPCTSPPPGHENPPASPPIWRRRPPSIAAGTRPRPGPSPHPPP